MLKKLLLLRKKKRIIILCALISLGLIILFTNLDHSKSNNSAAKRGVITKIVDGDTLDIDGIRIRLALVDTPERGHPGYLEATDFTASLCSVGTIAYYDTDNGQRMGSYNRIIAQVYCNDQSLNEQLIIHGHANIIVDFCRVSEFATESWAVNDCIFE